MLSRQDAIDRANSLIVAKGGRVVPCFDGIINERDEWITKLIHARMVDGRWSVVFQNLDPPGVATSPGCCIVHVDPETEHASFFDVL
jgi:hypothetical protein